VHELTVVETPHPTDRCPHPEAALQNEALELAPTLRAMYDQVDVLREGLNSAAAFLSLGSLYHLKVARLDPRDASSPSFPAHFDTEPHTHRTLSICLWLNSQWEEGCGGSLRVYPLPMAEVDIAPLEARACLFCSHQLLHRVMPVKKRPRYCVTLIFRGTKQSFPDRLPLALTQIPGMDEHILGMLLSVRKQQRSLVFLVWEEECARSMQEAFGNDIDNPEGGTTSDSTDIRHRAVLNFRKRCAAARAGLSDEMSELIESFLPLRLSSLGLPQVDYSQELS